MATPPSRLRTAGELFFGGELLRAAVKAPRLRSAPKGDGSPVILTPGLGATDLTLIPLRNFLGHLGYEVHPAGLGRITPNVRELVPRLADLARTIHGDTSRRVALVGWSIGGVISREVARANADAVSKVITMGSPVAGPSGTAMSGQYGTADDAAIAARIRERNRTPITVPVTAIWSGRDGIVSPEAARDVVNPGVEHVEVFSSHTGLGIDPDVWIIVAERLARQ